MLPYSELLKRPDVPPGSTWGLFGEDDDLGTVNFLTPEKIIAAAGLIRSGQVFNLDLPVGVFEIPVNHREAPTHTIFSNAFYHRDDKLDGLYLQGATQIDGLRHFAHPKYGFYNGTPAADIEVGTTALGIDRMVEHGIVGRGVLLDIARYREHVGQPIEHGELTGISMEDLEACVGSQDLRLDGGDIVLIRTGWLGYFLGLGEEERRRFPENVRSTGLEQSEELIEWLWDNQIALLAADNLAVEVVPALPSSPFFGDPDLSDLTGIHRGMAHPILLGLLGLPLGELWWLDDLAESCEKDRCWEFFLSSHPLNVIGGVGAPANAFAIR
jgi:kynurenine formamidase